MKKILHVFTFLLLSLNFVAAQNTFFICDTECRTYPLGDCDSGHTDTDNIEWPCNITLDDQNITFDNVSPDDLEQLTGVVDPLDARPQFINFDSLTMTVGVSFEDQVFTGTSTTGYKIVRTWTIIEWFSGQVFTWVQLIQNNDPNAINCDVMVCNNLLQVALAPGTPPSAMIWATDILEGDYSFCDPQNFTLELTDDAMQVVYSGVGSVTVTEEGSFTAVVTNPTTGNACWATITFEDKTSGVDCDVMVCNNALQVALAPGTPPSATVWATDILEGDYSLCDPQNFTLDIMDDAMQIVYSGTGSVTVDVEGSFTVAVTNPTTGNACWATIIFEDKTPGAGCDVPFVVCDTECNSAPLGDCDSGHTDTDNLEWPCDVTVNVPGISATNLTPKRMRDLFIVNAIDSEPTLVNYDCDLVAMVFEDVVFSNPDNSYKILRTWTLLDWKTGNVYIKAQVIKNEAPQASNCNTLACNDFINVALSTSNSNPIPTATLYVDAFLEGNYPNCDINTFIIKIETTSGTLITNSTGSVTLTQTGILNYTITDPSSGNSCWGQLNVEDRSTNCDTPFEVCDTECRTAPLGDCASGHTDSDNVEWPCDITIDVPGVEPQMLRVGNMSGIPGVDQFDIQPILIDYNCNFVAMTYEDNVFDLGALGFEISRKWTIIDWLTGNVFEYTQMLKNLAPGAVPTDCPQSLACQDVLSASLADNNWNIELGVSDFLEGAYPNCDISAFEINITDQVGTSAGSSIGNISLTTPGTFTYSITDPTTGNSCWGNLILSDQIFRTSGTKELSILSGVEVFPNPANEVINFEYEKLNLKGDVFISILDQSGRKLISDKNTNQLNISELTAGLYIYQISMENEIHHGKISVLK